MMSHAYPLNPAKAAAKPNAERSHDFGPVGFALGAGLGVAFGLVFSAAFGAESGAALARKKAASDRPLPHPLSL